MTAKNTIILLSDRSCLRITGEDRKQFLQGLVTNDLGLVSELRSIYACFLTPQGRFVIDFFVTQVPGDDAYWIEGPSSLLDSFMMQLKLYKLRSDVQIEKVTDVRVGALYSDQIEEIPFEAYVYKDSRYQKLGYRFIARMDQFIEQAGSLTDYHDLCLSYGIPQTGRDLVVNQTYILEAHLDRLNGVSFDKGCYLGQELTARMKYRGLLKRALYPFKLILGKPGIGSVLMREGKEIGKVTNLSSHFGMAFVTISELDKILAESCGLLELNDFTVEFFKPEWMS